MNKLYYKNAGRLLFLLSILFFVCGCSQKKTAFHLSNEEYDGPDKAAEFEFHRTKDPLTGTNPLTGL